MTHLEARLHQSGHLEMFIKLSSDYFKELLVKKIDTINFDQAKSDIQRFIKDPKRLNLWNKAFFKTLVEQIRLH